MHLTDLFYYSAHTSEILFGVAGGVCLITLIIAVLIYRYRS